MALPKVKICKINKSIQTPEYATSGSAGLDLCASIDAPQILKPGARALIPAGIAIELPAGYEAQIRPRSGLAIKNGISIVNSPGTIDSDYRGEIKIILINHSDEDFTITPKMKIAQMVIASYSIVSLQEVESLSSSARGQSGFGSTGT